MRHDLMPANAALARKHWAINFIKTCRALGMSDDEIRDALQDTQAPKALNVERGADAPKSNSQSA